LELGKIRDIFSDRQKPVFRNQLVTLGDLDALKTELLVSIKCLLTENKVPVIAKQWLKSYQVKKLLNISTGTLQNLRSNGTLPFTRIGGLIYYDADEINKMLEGKKKQSPKLLIPSLKSSLNPEL
jgi:hypothetical protein